MSLRDDFRNHFARQENRFPTPAGLRASVTGEAARAVPAERPSMHWAAAVAVLLAVAIVAGLLAAGALRHARFNPVPAVSPRANPTAPANPSGLRLVEVDAVGGSVFTLRCGTPSNGGQCQFWVSWTSDGGATWSAPVSVGPPMAPGEGDSGHHIHFVDRTNGFVYGNGTAFVTHDGGRTWRDSGLHFLEMVGAVGQAPWTWAVTYPCTKGTACAFKAYLSHDAGRTWPQSWDLPGNISPARVIAFGDGGLLISDSGAGDMYLTLDGGSHWTNVAGRCSASAAAAYAATSNGREFIEMCSADFPDRTAKSLFVSEDGGATWAKRAIPAGAGEMYDLVSPAPGTVLLAASLIPIMVTHDGGASWLPVTSRSSFGRLEFASATDGWAVGLDGSIWATTDGGQTWTQLAALS